MKEKSIWHLGTKFPESGAYVLVVYNGVREKQTIQQKALANFFETSSGDHVMAVGYFHPMWGESLDRRTHIPGVKYPKRTPKTNAAIVDVVGSPVDFWRGVKCWDYGRDIFAMTPKTGGKSQNDGFHFMCFGAILYCNTTEFPCLRFIINFSPAPPARLSISYVPTSFVRTAW